MPEIGQSLREARMRARIDISEIEAQTKIRAKYLRALENEEWDLLPGPTYVKSFLRTYADALHLDGKLLVEEYKLQHERLSDVELQPITPQGGSRNRAPSPRVSRLWFVVAAVIVLLVAIYALGGGWWSGSDDDGGTPAASTSTVATTSTGAATTPKTTKKPKKAASAVVRLQVVPSAPVYVCLESAGGKALIDGETLTPDSPSRTFRSKRFRINLGNGSVVLRVDGKTFNVPDSSDPVGYELTPKGRKTLGAGQRPTCAAA
jgi:cytoskeletal protein RodZ